ncbi:MAG: HlyD family efflux transporter periplasmic adaptor subunit [Microgenomates group bacterium]
MKKFKLYIVVVIVLVIAYFGYTKYSKSASQPTYKTTSVERGTLVVAISASGSVTSANNSPVLTDATGVVSRLYVKEGDKVTSGQKLADLELDQDSKQRYLQASASYQSAKNAVASAQASTYSANTAMWVAHEKLMSDAVARSLAPEDPTMIMQNSDWNSAELKYKTSLESIKQAQTSLASAALLLRQTSPTIYAPISGTVTGLILQVGSVRGTTSKIASITTSAAPIISVNLTEIDVPKVKVGNKVTVKVDALGKTYVGHVASIDIAGTNNSGVVTYPTYIQLDSIETGLLPNMTASASIITETKENVLMVPSTSVKNSNGATNIQVLKNGNLILTPAETGIQSDTQTEVLSGVSEGETVVTAVNQTTSVTTATKSAFSLPVRGIGGR